MAGQIRYDLSDGRFVGCSLEPWLCRAGLSVDGEPGLQHNNRNIKQTLQLDISSSSAGQGSSESQRGLRVPAVFPLRIKRAHTKPRISHKSKAAGKGEGASNGKHSPEHHDGLGKGPCECSLFWGGDNPSISTGQSCQAGPRWNPWNLLWFFYLSCGGHQHPMAVATLGIWPRAEEGYEACLGQRTVFWPLCKMGVLSSIFGGPEFWKGWHL